MIDQVVSRLSGAQRPRLDLRTLASKMLEEFGGYDGLARQTKKCFDINPEGGTNQVRILADVMKLIGQTQTLDDDPGDLSPEAIEAQLREGLAQMGIDSGK